jgi:hypothetical protein
MSYRDAAADVVSLLVGEWDLKRAAENGCER